LPVIAPSTSPFAGLCLIAIRRCSCVDACGAVCVRKTRDVRSSRWVRAILAAGVKVVCRLKLLDYVAKGKASHFSSSWAC